MDSKQWLISTIDVHKEQTARLRGFIQNFIVDNRYSLEDRWAVYEAACSARILEYNHGTGDLPTFDRLRISWYDDFYVDRGQTVRWANIVRQIDSRSGFYPHIDQIKEEILATGKAGFIYDW